MDPDVAIEKHKHKDKSGDALHQNIKLVVIFLFRIALLMNVPSHVADSRNRHMHLHLKNTIKLIQEQRRHLDYKYSELISLVSEQVDSVDSRDETLIHESNQELNVLKTQAQARAGPDGDLRHACCGEPATFCPDCDVH